AEMVRGKHDQVQEWGDEEENGAVFGITLRREPIMTSPNMAMLTDHMACNYVQYHTVKLRRLKAGTLEHLVTHLLDPESQEPDYVHVFLSTYRAFTSTNILIELSLTLDFPLFHANPALPGFIMSLNSNQKKKEKKKPKSDWIHFPQFLLSALHPVIKLWLGEYGADFHEPSQYQSLRLLCANLRRRLCFRRLAQTAEGLLKSLKEQDHSQFVPVDDRALLCKEKDRDIFMNFHVTDVAEQLTRLDRELFVQVLPFHCLGCVWSQRDKKENRNLAPSVRATISQFNAVTNLVITSLLCPSSPTRILEWWINVAQACRQLKNFSSLRAILSALQSNAVYRLKKTWVAVSKECIANFKHLCETFPDENCMLANQEILTEASNIVYLNKYKDGIVPYLGSYLTALTMLDTALPDSVEGGLINFEKRRREFEILSQIRQLQASCSHYQLPVNPRITNWLQVRTLLLTDQESYELSRELEPPIDPCPTSPNLWSSRLLTKKLLSSMHNITEDYASVSSSSSPILSSSSCSSSNPDLSSSSLGLRPDSLSSSSSSSVSTQSVLPVYNKQLADSCIIRVSMECVNTGNIYKSILLTSQDHTPQVIQRALDKHNLEDTFSCQDFSLCQMLNNGNELHIPDNANVYYAMCTTSNYDFVLHQRWRSHGRHAGSSSSAGAPRVRHAK
uniref:Ral guanine nucleotide dissociation stimulator-like 3a n=1 Tax=Hippocampus comes TaxID=109280 RepID=A0A3Q2Y8B0_HIPCM